MADITITEALAEVKTIERRIEKKREFVFSYFYRQEELKDPLAPDGGSHVLIDREVQAIRDLQERHISIRRAIAYANATTMLTVHGIERSIADWLTWRREIAINEGKFLGMARQRINQLRQEALKQGRVTVGAGEGGPARAGDIIVNISEKKLAEDIEAMDEILGTLDGALSLKNATTFVAL